MSSTPDPAPPSLDPAVLPTAGAIAFLGGGNMARALIGGLLRNGIPAARLRVAEPLAESREVLARDFGIATHADNRDAAHDAALWVLAVKPQVLRGVCETLAPLAQTERPVVLSIAAGIRSAQIAQWLGGQAAVVRAMPNTPALLGVGATGLCANRRVNAEGRALAQQVMQAVGLCRWLDDETLMDTVTALSGSGPAYFFLLAEALEHAAVTQGLSAETARALAAQTCLGAGRMLTEGSADAATLRQRVTSPGGTTAAALQRFEAGHFTELVAAAVQAATTRGVELATQADAAAEHDA